MNSQQNTLDTKKTYETPKLVSYGNLRELTRSTHASAFSDSGGNHKT
jgi:hypothetical protein